MRNFLVLVAFLILRILSAFLVKTWYVPDEYWQSLEVGHKLAFGYGHLTWEWTKGIRSYIHPMLIAGVYKALEYFSFDHVELLILVPRLLQAILTAWADYRFYSWCNYSKWSVFLISSAWFWFYTGSRTLSNTVEATLTTIALSYYPWRSESTGFIWFVALVTFIRPTAAIPWLPLCLNHIIKSKFAVFELILKRYLISGLFVGSAAVALDTYAHGSLIVTPYEFLKVNFWDEIGSFYGTHPWHWYFTAGLPTILGILTIPFLFATIETIRNRKAFPDRAVLLFSIIFTLIVYSVLPHKEFRFILPLLPMCLHISADYISRWSRKASKILLWLVAIALLIGNVVPAIYLSYVHQKGTLDVMPLLANISKQYKDESGNRAKILFLMPCHSTPYYSHIHQNVTMRFLTCEPNFSKSEYYMDEADHFYKDPAAWIRSHLPVYPRTALPSHVILFDNVVDKISVFLSNFQQIHEIQHSEYVSDRIGKTVLVYQRVNTGSDTAIDENPPAN